jgi:hypothetical protein
MMQAGDTIWRIQGSCVLLMLRASGQNYRLIGERYLHGADKLLRPQEHAIQECVTIICKTDRVVVSCHMYLVVVVL